MSVYLRTMEIAVSSTLMDVRIYARNVVAQKNISALNAYKMQKSSSEYASASQVGLEIIVNNVLDATQRASLASQAKLHLQTAWSAFTMPLSTMVVVLAISSGQEIPAIYTKVRAMLSASTLALALASTTVTLASNMRRSP